MPTISIITATYNAAATLADCLRSVASQNHPAEHIIIDGASTDTTLEVVRRVSPASRILSGPDNGIYDAMNKGIALTTGEVVGILNADDFYASPQVLEKVARVFEDPAVMSCYGDLEYVKECSGVSNGFSVIRYWKSGPFSPDRFYWGWMPPHPTFFVRRSVYERFGLFKLDQGSAADYELMLRLLLKERITTAYIPETLVRMRVGGASNVTFKARLKANRMDRRGWEVNGLKPYPWTTMMKPLRKVVQWVKKHN
jgi:glycosyltransferase involved in cell wall biosynthesis